MFRFVFLGFKSLGFSLSVAFSYVFFSSEPVILLTYLHALTISLALSVCLSVSFPLSLSPSLSPSLSTYLSHTIIYIITIVLL